MAILLLFLYFLWPSFLYSQCTFPPLVKGEPWDHFWAQHYVGADLFRKELEQSQSLKTHNPASFIDVWDTSREEHGEYVSQIIAGPQPSALIPFETILPYRDLDERNYIENYRKLFTNCLQTRSCPIYINNSMGWNNSSTIAYFAAILSSRGSTLIAAAGNENSPVPAIRNQLAKNNRLLLVSSLDPDGYPSKFTNFGETVTIAAPADFSLRSYNFKGDQTDFGGTSGATPLVTGALGGFSLLSGYPLNTWEAKFLLQKTSIPLPWTPKEHLVGVGMLNAYKISRVALALKERCHTSPEHNECISDALRSENTYQFERESTKLMSSATKFFPECFPETASSATTINACQRTEAFHDLRKAAFLDSSNTQAWSALSCVKEKYFEEHQRKGIMLYQSLSQIKTQQQIIRTICLGETFRERSLIKYLMKPALLKLTEIFDQNKCHPKTLGLIADATYGRRISKPEEILEKIIAYHQLTDLAFAKVVQSITRNFNVISNPEYLLEKMIAHNSIDDHGLAALASIVDTKFHELSHAETLLTDILHHKKASQQTIQDLSTIVIRKFAIITSANHFLEEIFAHDAVNEEILVYIAKFIGREFPKIAHAQSILEVIISHHKAKDDTLAQVARSIGNNFKHIIHGRELLEKITNHKMIGDHGLAALAFTVGLNFNKITNGEDFFERAFHHKSVGKQTLIELAKSITKNLQTIPYGKKLLQDIFQHPQLTGIPPGH